MFCLSVGPETCSRRTGGSLDGTSMDVLVVAIQTRAGAVGSGPRRVQRDMQLFEYRSVRYWSKENNGTLTGGRKK